MAKSNKSRSAKKNIRGLTPIKHVPGCGLVVAMEQQTFPATADQKITCAKSIIQAVVAAHDSEALSGDNYDIHWPLSLAVELLEQATRQIGGSQS
jgi:hypothetical protein